LVTAAKDIGGIAAFALLALAALASRVVLGKSHTYPEGCHEAAEVKVNELLVPIDGGRVCKSSSSEAKILFISSDRNEYVELFHDELTSGSRYKQSSCAGDACVFEETGITYDRPPRQYQLTVTKEPPYIVVIIRDVTRWPPGPSPIR
jgi:hypothetical protein